MYGDVRPHHFIPFGVVVYGGLGPAAYAFLRKTQRRFRKRRYMEANAEGGEQVDGNGDGDEDEDEEAARGGVVGWKEKWVRLLSFALARGVAGLIIRRVVRRCPAGSGWRWAGGGRVTGGMGPDLDRGEADRREGAERLALMDRAWEDAFEETDYATQDGSGGGTQESEGTQRERSGQASGIGGLSQAASSVEDILNEWDDLLSPGPEGGVWTQEQSGASPEQAMALAEGGVATLMGASRRVAGLLGGVDGMGGTDEDDGGDVGRSAGGVDTRRAPQSPGAHPGSDDHLQQVARQHTASHQLPCPPGEVAGRAGTNITAQVWSALLKFAATSQGNQRKGSSHGELVLGVEGYRRKSVADAQVWMRATQFIILSPLGQRLGILAVAWEFPLVDDEVRAGIVQEMNKLKIKYAERMEACKKEVELLWPGDRPNTGGWSAADHARFVRIRGTAVKSAEGKGPAREALLTALANALPDIAKEIGLPGIGQHEDWHHMHRIIVDRQRSINRSQAEDVEHLLSQSRSLLEKVRGMQLAKAEAAAQLLQQEAGLLQRHMRLDVLRTDHFHRQAELQALQAEQEAEAAAREAEAEALRQEERERQRVLIDEYRKHLAELKKEKEMEEEEAARAQQLLMDEQSELNAERVEYRQQEYLAKLDMKKEGEELKQLEEMAKEERLAKLRAQVEPSVEADTERMMAPTAAHAQYSDVSSKAEMFSVHGYDTDKLLQDKRFRVMEALAGANIKNADLRMAALEGTKPMRAPRMDNMTTMQKEAARGNG
ncbi:hypothetical protein CYMTET_27642 [Cymbomonas tetramitiformis]|uniref:Uncharacterized protein n=1 Tax=Cymbomonas tetramitiformis TaxID=36881 RepID=A0AAE0FPJ9_9CHLO|nr:hypothetical protein CYMTET_27642 [Cymbomonas tetramitiformis]